MRRVAVVIIAGLCAAASACSDKVAGPLVPTTPEASYTLTSAEGVSMPYARSVGDYRNELTSGALVLSPNGTFVRRWMVTDYIGGMSVGAYPDSSTGSWTRAEGSSTIALTDAFDQSVINAQWAGFTVTLTAGELGVPLVLVYTR
jgi:hypothetical protein